MERFIKDKIEHNKALVEVLQAEIAELETRGEKAKTAKGLDKWCGFGFESSSGLTDEFAQFARDFKKHISGVLPEGAELVQWNRGHFYVSGFVKRGNKFVYFSIPDVRYSPDGWNSDILIRTAEHEKDYTGGSNNNTDLAGFGDAVIVLLGCSRSF